MTRETKTMAWFLTGLALAIMTWKYLKGAK